MIDTLERGGAQNQLLLIARHLQEQGLPPFHLIVFREPLTLLGAFKEAGANVILIEKQKEVDLPFFFKLRNCLRELKPQVVVSFLITADMWGRLAALMAGVPRIGCSIRSLPQDLGMVKNVFLRLMDKLSDFIVCNSRLAAEVTAARSGLKKEKVTVIYNGIAFDETVEMVHPSIERNEVVIGLVARLVPLKGVTTLLKAFSEIYSKGNVRLVIVGDGPSRVTLEEETLSLGIADKVNFLGERLDAKEIIKGFDIGVLTSEYEGLSNAIMEYMQAGKPVVASKVGGNPELVEDGVTGYLFDYGQADQLAKILNNLIATPDRRLEMGARGHNKIIKHFSINSMMNNWENQL